MDEEIKNSSLSYNNDSINKNHKYLKHLIDCIEHKKSKNVRDATVKQLEELIEKYKDKVKNKHSEL